MLRSNVIITTECKEALTWIFNLGIVMQKNLGSRFLETQAVLSGVSELIWGFTAAGMEHGRGKLLFSAALPPAGCAGLEAHQMFWKPLILPFFFLLFLGGFLLH